MVTSHWTTQHGNDLDYNRLENVYAIQAAVAALGVICIALLPVQEPYDCEDGTVGPAAAAAVAGGDDGDEASKSLPL